MQCLTQRRRVRRPLESCATCLLGGCCIPSDGAHTPRRPANIRLLLLPGALLSQMKEKNPENIASECSKAIEKRDFKKDTKSVA